MRFLKPLASLALSLSLGLAITSPLFADRFPVDPVEEFRKTLVAVPALPVDELKDKANKVQGAGNLLRALLLRDWGLDIQQLEVWNLLVTRFFKDDAPKAFKDGDPALAVALSAKLVELADTIPKNVIPRTTILEGKLAELFPVIAPLGQSSDPGVRAAAVRLASRLRGQADVVLPWMENLLATSDPTTRRAVAEAFGSMIDQSHSDVARTPYSERELGDDPELLGASLILVPNPHLISRIVGLAGKAMGDSDPDVRRLSIIALEKATRPLTEVGGEPVPFILSEKVDKDYPVGIATKLKEFDKKYQAFYDGTLEERVKTLPTALGSQGAVVGAALVDADTKVKFEARRAVDSFARALNKTPLPPPKKPMPDDKRPRTLRLSGPNEALPVAHQAKPEEPLLEGIRQMVPFLVKALEDPNPTLRIRTAENLVSLGKEALTPEIIQALKKALGDRNVFVRWVSARALGQMAQEVENSQDKDRESQFALLTTAVPELIKTFGERDLDVRMAVAETLGQLGPAARDAVPALTKAVGTGDAEIREKAILALQGIGQDSVSAIPALIQALTQTGYFQVGGGRGAGTKVRIAAADLLGQFGKDAASAIPALRQALSDEDEDVREAASQALLRITNPEIGL